MNTLHFHHKNRALRKVAGLGLILVSLTACNLNATTNPAEGVDFRQARYLEVMRIDTFQSCQEEALTMDRQARTRDSAGAYITSATVMEKCEANLGGNPRGVATDDRMRLSALATVNYLKGGDTEKARSSFAAFKRTFPDQDLYFADGSSFIATAELLLERAQPMGFGTFATLNVNRDVKNEMRRLTHWKDK